MPGPGPGPGLAPETFSVSSSPPRPVTSLYMAVPTARFLSESHISGVHSFFFFFFLSRGTMSFQVADAILLCLCLSHTGSFPPLLTSPFIPRGSGLRFRSR